MNKSRAKDNTILFLAAVIAVGGYYFYKTHERLEHITSIFERIPKLKACVEHPRKMKFLERGGDYFPNYKKPRTLNDKVIYLYENYFLRSPITRVIGTKYFAKKYVKSVR